MGKSTEGKRRFARVPCEYRLLVRTAGKADDEVFSKTKMLGLGGCSFTHPRRLKADTNLWVSIALNGRVIEAAARVVYANPRDDGEFDTGIDFVKLSQADEAILAAFLQDPQGKKAPSSPGG